MNGTTFLNSFYNGNNTMRNGSPTAVETEDVSLKAAALPASMQASVMRMFNKEELKQMEPSAESRLKEMQTRAQEAEAARVKAIKDGKRLQQEIDRLNYQGANGLKSQSKEEVQNILKNLYDEIMPLVEDNNNLRKQIGQGKKQIVTPEY